MGRVARELVWFGWNVRIRQRLQVNSTNYQSVPCSIFALLMRSLFFALYAGPFSRPVVTIMTLKNNANKTLVFKIKTTAPKRYCVRPNIGKIAPFHSTQVESE